MDVSSVSSSVKSWLYADQLVKPEEKIMFRTIHHLDDAEMHLGIKGEEVREEK